MITRIVFIVIFFFSIFSISNISIKEANAQSRLAFCNAYGDEDCKFSCGDFTSLTSWLSAIPNSGDTGNCVGRATKFQIIIRKLELGTSAGYNATGDNARCEVFSGTLTSDIGSASPNQVLSNKPLKKCKDVIYDRIYVTWDRKMVFAANATFPTNDSGGNFVARTTSACASDSLSLSVVANFNWLDTSKNNNGTQPTACYVRTSTSESDIFVKTKLNSLGIASDYSGMTSNVDNDYDDFKSAFVDSLNNKNSVSTPNFLTKDPTFYEPSGLGGFEGEKLDTDTTREIMVLINGSDIITGSGFGVRYDKKKQHEIKISYIAGNQTKGYGARFLFVNDSGVPKIIGSRNDDNGMYIIFNQY
jgi:hypothetical protein